MRKKPAHQQVPFLRALLWGAVRAIVEHENQMFVTTTGVATRVAFTVWVNESDMGLVLGEGGATADAIRRVVWTACKKTDLRADIEFKALG